MQDASGLAGEVFKPVWWQEWCRPDYSELQPSATKPGRMVKLTSRDLLRENVVQAVLPDIRSVTSYQAADLAVSKSKTADYYARTNAYGDREGGFYIAEVLQTRDLGDQGKVEDMANAARRFKVKFAGVETTGFQSVYFRSARGQYPWVQWRECDPGGEDKVSRARSLAAACERGYKAGKGGVYLLHGAPWVPMFLLQATAFPGGAHDDMVDTAVYCYLLAAGLPPGAWRDAVQTQKDLRQSDRGELRKLFDH